LTQFALCHHPAFSAFMIFGSIYLLNLAVMNFKQAADINAAASNASLHPPSA